jgi:flagellar protein FliT
MTSPMLQYYEAIERASADMLQAARTGDWEQVVKIEGSCVLLISQLKHASSGMALSPADAKLKARIMHRIVLNDAQIRALTDHAGDPLADATRPALLH